MKDIYSPLEIDEEWDNYSPVDAAAPAIEAPATSVPVTSDNMNNLPTSGIEPGAADAGVNMDQYKKDATADTGVDMSKLNNDPARDAANSIIATEQKTNDGAPAVEDNIAKWTANDGKDAEAMASTDKLEYGDMGSKLDQDATNSYNIGEPKDSVKVNVSPAPDSAPAPAEASDSAENSNMNDVPKPVEISMGGSDDGELTYSAESNVNDMPKPDVEELGSVSIEPLPVMPTAPAAENTNTPDSKEDMLSNEVDVSSPKKSKPMGELLPFKPKGELLEKNPVYAMKDAGNTESNDYTETESVSALEQYKATKSEALADLQRKYEVLQKTLAEEESVAKDANNKVEATRTVLAEMQQTIESEKKSLAA